VRKLSRFWFSSRIYDDIRLVLFSFLFDSRWVWMKNYSVLKPEKWNWFTNTEPNLDLENVGNILKAALNQFFYGCPPPSWPCSIQRRSNTLNFSPIGQTHRRHNFESENEPAVFAVAQQRERNILKWPFPLFFFLSFCHIFNRLMLFVLKNYFLKLFDQPCYTGNFILRSNLLPTL